jgi:regulator of sirC expression with transglutaminase-like and TPR domain
MNALLLSEISAEHVDPISALALIEQHIFERPCDLSKQIDQIVRQCQSVLEPEQDILQQVECFLDNLYITQLLADNKQERWPLLSFTASEAVGYKTIAPTLKVILVQYIAKACGFDCEVVFIPDTFMIRINCDEELAVIFDPITGEGLNWQELDVRMSDVEGDPSSFLLSGEKNKMLLFNYLTSLKNTLIHEQYFQPALKCVDILLALHPDDPIERRDRGFLLHQLDCFKVAFDDYRYFVEQCPQDPAAQLLKLQLDNIKISDNVLH